MEPGTIPRGPVRQGLQWALHLVRDNLALFLLLGLLAGVAWLLAARGLKGPRLTLWLLVPILLAGTLVCLIGPGHLFPKQPYEGPNLITVSHNHAITLLDLPGGLCAIAAAIIGARLIRERWAGGRRVRG